MGSGFAGLGAAIRLDRAGRRDFLVIERGSEVGGTWRDNTYPGAASDIPSHLYSFSFAPNDWSREFSTQPEIQSYLRRTAERSGTLDRHVFNCEMLSPLGPRRPAMDGRDDTGDVYRHDSGDRIRRTVRAEAAGTSPGIDQFAGDMFHSARWQHDADLTGRRVAVIGTGASSIQMVPEIASVAAHLDVYQRTAPWIMPRGDHRFSAKERRAFRRVPGYQLLRRGLIFSILDLTSLGFAQPRGFWI